MATGLLALGLFLTGMVAFTDLPVAPLPKVDFPTISVSARLPGADPVTMAATVTAPLERRLGQIGGVTELTSTSGVGTANITAQFELSRDINGAARDVMAALNASGNDLPVDLPTLPTYRKVNPADSPILILAVTSTTIGPGRLYDASDSILAQRISQVEGVADIVVSGADKPAVRVSVDPHALAATGLSMEDVRTAIARSNALTPKGSIHGEKLGMAINVNDQIRVAADYARLSLRPGAENTLRLADVAQVTESVENRLQSAWYNNDKAVLIIISKQQDANVIDTVNRIKALLPQLESWMPPGTAVSVLSDRTQTIRASVHDVEITMLISIALVIGVVYLSLGHATPTIAASITVPLSLAGTFAAMWLLGYSLNNISLLALIISVGFVIDDAIVMIENISRHVEEGDSPTEAAIKGAKEVFFTVVSIGVSLAAVFIPLLFMGGIIGRMFREFAVTLSVAVLISVIVSVTVTPTVYAQLMRLRRAPHKKNHPGERVFHAVQMLYERGLFWVMRHQRFMLLVTVATVGATVALYVYIPKGFFPPQDTGMIFGNTQARTDISFQEMAEKQQEAARIILSDPAVAALGSVIGSGGRGGGSGSQGRFFISLKPYSERKINADQVIARLRPKLTNIQGAAVFLRAGQDIRVGGRASNAQYQFTLWGESLEELRQWTPKLIERLKQEEGITDVSSDQENAAHRVEIIVDRDAAARLGVDMASIDGALQNAFSQRQVSTMYTDRNQYRVVLEVSPDYQKNVAALDAVHVPSRNGGQIRLSAFSRVEAGFAPVSVMHQGQFPASTLSFNLTEGGSLGDAFEIIQNAATSIGMPASLHSGFAGNAKAFADSVKSQPMLILAGLLTIYLVLGVLYEHLLHPLTILSTLPSAGIGALLALWGAGYDLSLISVIGVILLMGIVKKNGILLVDFAIVAERERGMSPEAAILEACSKRFRPILMTTLAAVLGALPLILAGGTGAELRRPLGVAVVGGLVVSQLLTLYTTPVVYLALEKLSRKKIHRYSEAV